MQTSLFPWLTERGTGVLLHPTSFPSDVGVGNFGSESRRFIDYLQAAGFNHWQVCPLGPTGYGDSPYQPFSSFAGNPYLIDLRMLVALGLLKAKELKPLNDLPQDHVDYGALYQHFWPILDLAYQRFAEDPKDLPDYGDYSKFKAQHASWLVAYAAFCAGKKHFEGKPWYQWPAKYRSFDLFKKTPLLKKLSGEMEKIYFQQYLFFGQWRQLHIYAKKKNIQIIGDLPIFVAADSADVWTNPEIFQISKQGKLKASAGVPPDYFSPLGQHWGNPLYDWEAHQKTDYKWWKQRFAINFEFFEILRLDHFRGFEDYWSIPAKAADARTGSWEKGPSLDFFKAIQKEFPKAKLIAEDLGEITPEVVALREASGLPGMTILQFAFGSGANNLYLPHNSHPNSVVYPGTHDNDTTLGWYRSASENECHHYRTYFSTDGAAPQWDAIRAAYASVSRLAVIPMQDLLNLGSEGRLNIPGTSQGNWQWRYSPWQLENLWSESTSHLLELKETYYR